MSNNNITIAKVIVQLRAYQVRYPDESTRVEQFIDFFQRNRARGFDRNLCEGHATASAWLLNPDATHVLLTHHRKLNRWLQLGGHADGETDLRSVALAEAREESGIGALEILFDGEFFDIERHLIPEREDEPAHFHYDFRYALRAQHREYTVSDESHDLCWAAIGRLGEYSDDTSLLRMGRKWCLPDTKH